MRHHTLTAAARLVALGAALVLVAAFGTACGVLARDIVGQVAR